MKDLLLTEERIGLNRVTPSMLDAFEQCPKLFYYQIWLGLQLDEDKLHLDFGNAIHSAVGLIHMLYDNNFGGGWEGQIFADIEKDFKQHWKQQHVPQETFDKYMLTRAGRESGFKTKEDLYEYFKEDGLAMLQSYWDQKEQLLTEYGHDWTELEKMMKVPMHNPEKPEDKLPIPLSMRIDAVNRDKTKMGDFKTSGSKYNVIETRKKIQGQCYLFGNLMKTKEFIGKFDYIVLRKGLKNPERIEIVELEYDRADMMAFYARVKNILLKIANREFDAPMVGHMPYCQCRKYEEALSVEGIELLKSKEK